MVVANVDDERVQHIRAMDFKWFNVVLPKWLDRCFYIQDVSVFPPEDVLVADYETKLYWQEKEIGYGKILLEEFE